jgi:hypothetical protein
VEKIAISTGTAPPAPFLARIGLPEISPLDLQDEIPQDRTRDLNIDAR